MSTAHTATAENQTVSPSSHSPQPEEQSDANGATFGPELDLISILSSADETCYRWDFASDGISWAQNAKDILGVSSPNNLTSGAAFHQLIDPDFANQRYEAIRGTASIDSPDGFSYSVQYKLRPNGRRNSAVLWIEDYGRCFAGPHGEPAFAQGVVRVINQRYQEEQRLLHLSRHDELTGHLNRIALVDAMGKALEHIKRDRGSGAFIMIAINNLSHVNEVYGFDIGDEMIQIVGQRLRAGLRDGDAIGRYSSNKFGLMLRHSGRDQLPIIAQRFHDAINDSVIDSTAGALAASICQGCVLVPEQADTVPLILSRSLEALEQSKASPSTPISLYEPSEQRESRRRKNVVMADRIIRALNERRMVLALQPIARAESRKPAFYEVLMRMREPDGTIVPAGEFIPVAEHLGLVRLIDQRVLELTLHVLRATQNISVSLNVSGVTATDPAWLEKLKTLTNGDRSLTRRMMVEITETTAISDIDESIRFVKALKALGCRVAIDDFGAGYSSFRNLRLLDFDMVKIDGSFVRNLPNSQEDQILVRALVDLARNFGMETVAEWVTDEATASLAKRAGVSYLQGFYLGKPKLIDFEQTASDTAIMRHAS
ncbi:MAG: GGDEF and EAL domain-containing protein [Hyphomicrobiaceae bacterium]|nr:GGDEF and EAL domain-containing protein [Hyphomicrobiaceae bacterium]